MGPAAAAGLKVDQPIVLKLAALMLWIYYETKIYVHVHAIMFYMNMLFKDARSVSLYHYNRSQILC